MTQTNPTFGHRNASVSRLVPIVVAATLLPACFGFQFKPASSGSQGRSGLSQPASSSAVAAESRASLTGMRATPKPQAGYATASAGSRSSACGALNQRPCLVWESIPSCNSGLVENLLAHRCVSSGPDGALASNARAVSNDLADLLVALGGYITCFDPKLLEAAINRSDAAYAKQLQSSSCMQRMGAMAASRGYQTVTVGISGGGSFVIGGFVDTGFAFDTAARRTPTLYQTKAISIGFQAGGGVGINVGLYKGSNAVDTAGTDTQGFSFEAGAGAGAGTAIWYDYDGRLDGLSVSAIAGASGKAGAYNRINTAYYDLEGNNPMVCGGAGQRACKLWERTRSCDSGLAEDLKAGICRRAQDFPCGHANQRACKLWERVPSCNAGLYENLLQGKCYKPAPKKKLACGAKNQRPCKLWERVPSCNPGLAEHFLVGQCR
jgi:hypothetical protein